MSVYRKIFVAAFLAAIALAIAVTGAWVYVADRADDRIASSIESLTPEDVGLVLGSSRLLRGNLANPYFDNRIEAAAALFKSGKVKYLVVSGNQARGGREAGGYDEPTDMRDALVAAGVPPQRIYRDYAGFRTSDLLRARSVFGQERVIVVSQRFHLERALFLAAEHGLSFQGFEAKDAPFRYDFTTKIREAGARLWALSDVAIGRAPRLQGKSVQIGVDPPT